MGVDRLLPQLEGYEEKLWYLLVAGVFGSCWVYGLEIECGRVMGILLGTLGCMIAGFACTVMT